MSLRDKFIALAATEKMMSEEPQDVDCNCPGFCAGNHNEALVSWAENIGVMSPRIDGYTLVKNLNDLAAYTRSLEKDLSNATAIMYLLVKELEK